MLAEPVRWFGDEGDQQQHDCGESPLCGDGDLVRPRGVHGRCTLEDPRRNQRADRKGEIGHCRDEPAQHERGDLAYVRGSADRVEGDDAAVHQLADKQLGGRVAEELDEDEADGEA